MSAWRQAAVAASGILLVLLCAGLASWCSDTLANAQPVLVPSAALGAAATTAAPGETATVDLVQLGQYISWGIAAAAVFYALGLVIKGVSVWLTYRWRAEILAELKQAKQLVKETHQIVTRDDADGRYLVHTSRAMLEQSAAGTMGKIKAEIEARHAPMTAALAALQASMANVEDLISRRPYSPPTPEVTIPGDGR